jgi:hypothetical protein
MTRNMYNRLFWELCYCVRCGRLNYVEPEGATARCACSPLQTRHKRIPMKYRSAGGTVYDGPPRIANNAGRASMGDELSRQDEE